MSTRDAYKVHDAPVRIPIARREVSRVAVSSSHVTLELTSLKDPLKSTVDLFEIGIDLGRADDRRRQAIGAEGATIAGLLGRRVTSCVGTPDGGLELRMTGSASVRSRGWNVALGDGRHWAPHVDGRVAEWRPSEWRESVHPRRRAVRREAPLDSTTALPLAGQHLEAISFTDQGLGLTFVVDAEAQPPRSIERLPDVEVELKGPLVLTPDRHVVNAGSPPSVAPLLSLVGVATTGATATPGGGLEIRFAGGAVAFVEPGESAQWALTIADLGGWYWAKDGSVTFSKPREVRPLSGAARPVLVRAYLEYAATDRPDLFWSFDRLRDLIEHAPEDAYEVIRELVRQAPSPYVLGIVAAGPLEDLLSDWGERVIDRLETDARDDPKLMAACAGVWKLYMPDEVWDRLRRLVSSEPQDAPDMAQSAN